MKLKRLLVPFIYVAEFAAIAVTVPLTVVTGIDLVSIPIALDKAGTWALDKEYGGPK